MRHALHHAGEKTVRNHKECGAGLKTVSKPDLPFQNELIK